jgi:hypothetical protein
MNAAFRSQGLGALALAALLSACASPGPPRSALFPIANLRGVMFTAPQVLADAQRTDLGGALNAVVLAIDEKSSYRAVANAVTRLRERDQAVGFWIDCASAQGREPAAADFEARVARVRDLLAKHVRADAIFLAGLEGPPAACGCGSLECCRSEAKEPARDAREAARIVAAVSTFSQGALVVPVWLDGCAPPAHECSARDCRDADCVENATRAWNAMRAESARIALLLHDKAGTPQAIADVSARIAGRLQTWMSLPAPPLPATTSGSASFIAVLSAADFAPGDLGRAIAGVQLAQRMGLLIDYTPIAAAARGE